MELGLQGKKALVTGGSKGIGLETARCLAREGAQVLICARREGELVNAAADIEKTTGKAVAFESLDVTDKAAIARLPALIERKLGDIDFVVNVAGIGTYKPFLEVSDEELEYGIAINFFAPYRISQKVVPMMIARGGGHIINIAGATGMIVTNPPFLSSSTGPAKAAEIRLSRILANELAPHKIRVNCVVPGLIMTPERFAKWEREMAQRQLNAAEGEETRQDWAAAQGMRDTRWGTPEEIANLIVFTLSDASAYVNGAVLVADNCLNKG